MYFKIISIVAILLITTKCFSQDTDVIGAVTKINFLSPGMSYEKRIGKNQSLYAEVFGSVTAYLAFSSSGGPGTRSGLYIDPAVTFQYRYYYNAEKRKAKGKKIGLNNLNYLCAIAQTVFSSGSISGDYLPEDKRRAINMFGIALGLQRNYARRFSLDLQVGGGYFYTRTTKRVTGQNINKNVGRLTSVANVKLGFWLNRRK